MKKLLGLFLLLPLFAWAQSPFDGTWKFNLNDAQFSQKPETFGIKNGEYTCSTCIPKVSVKADGSDQAVPGAKGYDTLAVKAVDKKTTQFTRKKAGKVVNEETDILSDDGKTMNFNFKSYPPQGDPVTGSGTLTRVGAVPAGDNPSAGSWRMTKLDSVSDNGRMLTFKATSDGLNMSSPTGESYEAKFDGKDYPVKGDRAGGSVSLKKLSDSSIQETYKQDGKPVSVNTMTFSGSTMKLQAKDPRRGTTESYTATKQ